MKQFEIDVAGLKKVGESTLTGLLGSLGSFITKKHSCLKSKHFYCFQRCVER